MAIRYDKKLNQEIQLKRIEMNSMKSSQSNEVNEYSPEDDIIERVPLVVDLTKEQSNFTKHKNGKRILHVKIIRRRLAKSL